MKCNLFVTTLCITCLSLLAQPLQQTALSQSPAELRAENRQLKAENEQLKRELEAATARITALERSVTQLTRALEAVSQGHAPEEVEKPLAPGSVDESVPSASPRALFNALVASYNEAVGEMPSGEPRSRERNAYMRTLQQWRATLNRDYRAPIEWHVRVAQAEGISAGYTMQLIVIDPKNKAELGDAFELQVSRAHARPYELRKAEGELGLFVLRGVLTPNVHLNVERATRGLFDQPRFIGPFAEFGMSIDVRGLIPEEDLEQ